MAGSEAMLEALQDMLQQVRGCHEGLLSVQSAPCKAGDAPAPGGTAAAAAARRHTAAPSTFPRMLQLEAAQGGVDEEARAHLDMLRGQLGVLDQVQARHAAVAAAAEDAAPAVPTSSGGAPGAARAASSSGIGNGGMTAATSAVARDAVTMLHEMDGCVEGQRGRGCSTFTTA